MAGNKMNGVLNESDSTAPLDYHYALLKQTLSTPRVNNGLTIRFGQSGISLDLFFDPVFPEVQILEGHR
jgi:hypothetical protein